MLICCGLTTLDITQVVQAVPGANEKIVATRQLATFGGPAANAAATAVALGAPARLVTAVGAGPLADVVRAELARAGVDVLDLAAGGSPPRERGEVGPAVSTVLVTAGTGERAVVSTNAAERPVVGSDPAALDRALARPGAPGGRAARGPGVSERDVLLLDGHHPQLAHGLATRARDAGFVVVLDGGSWKDGTRGLIALCDAVVLSADFRMPAVDADRVLDAVAALGPGFVARSRGPAPLEVLERGRRSTISVPRVERVVDTLGAGDVLHGAFAAEVARGLPWGRALASAAAVASRSVAFEGALGWVSAPPAPGL
ncbi:PfkB family carbohydrate kinase [Oerskovia turbata]